MNKQDLAAYVAKKTGLFQKDALVIIDSLTRAIQEALIGGDKVIIRGLGKFETRQRVAMKKKNLIGAKEIEIPAYRVPFFKPSRKLKEKVRVIDRRGTMDDGRDRLSSE